MSGKRLNAQDAADYVGVSKSTLEKLRTAGGGPRYIKLSKKVLYDVEDLDRWLESRKQASTADIPALRGRQRHNLGR
jgi:predicted DNA-binding transcriptional regulator AlpA